jgi:hypothetical protein
MILPRFFGLLHFPVLSFLETYKSNPPFPPLRSLDINSSLPLSEIVAAFSFPGELIFLQSFSAFDHRSLLK